MRKSGKVAPKSMHAEKRPHPTAPRQAYGGMVARHGPIKVRVRKGPWK